MKNIVTIVAALLAAATYAQNIYEINEPETPKAVKTGHLAMGGANPAGERIDVNSSYMSIAGRPVIPVTGEFHFSRYPNEQWEEEIVKMKAGGVTVIPTYVFWSLHEPDEGQWHWDGNLNLRKFVELCKKHDMPVIVRIGPFCHGEIRSGAIPDWAFTKPMDIRSDDPMYLGYARKLYSQIADQLRGLYYKDGGPVIGCQIENEMQHSAAPWAINYPTEPTDYTTSTYDSKYAKVGVSIQDTKISTAELGERHLKTLKDMAVELGIVTPFYTVTGWGNAAVLGNEAIPVTAAYPYNFWSKPAPSRFMLFKDLTKHPDYEPVRYNPEDFPSFCAEMGVGMQPIYKRRPIVTAQGAEALMLRSLGSGANGIGYYMYHGGSTPLMANQITSNQDEPMGMPKVSYDYMAPLGEFGLEHESYRTLRLIHSFLADFGDRLAPMEVVLPEGCDTMTPADRDRLRYAARMKAGSGFVFMVNFQDHDDGRHDQQQLTLKINLKRETITIPDFTLPKDASVIVPFNMDLDGVLLRYATAQPLMRIMDAGKPHYFFFAIDGMKTEYAFRGKTFRPVPGLQSTFSYKGVKVTTLTRQQALNASKADGKLLITEAMTLPYSDGEVTLAQMGATRFEYILYPSKYGFKTQTVSVEAVPQASPHVAVTPTTLCPAPEPGQLPARRMSVSFDPTQPAPQVSDWFLEVDYTGDVAMAFLDNHLVLDHFYFGQPWRIGLKRFPQMATQPMNFYIRPIRVGASFLIDLPADKQPDFTNGNVLRLNSVRIIPQYKATIKTR